MNGYDIKHKTICVITGCKRDKHCRWQNCMAVSCRLVIG